MIEQSPNQKKNALSLMPSHCLKAIQYTLRGTVMRRAPHRATQWFLKVQSKFFKSCREGQSDGYTVLHLIHYCILSFNNGCLTPIRIHRIPLLATIYIAKAFSWTIWWNYFRVAIDSRLESAGHAGPWHIPGNENVDGFGLTLFYTSLGPTIAYCLLL